MIDLTIKGLAPGYYWATVRECGDISRGAASTGGIWGCGTGESPTEEVPKGVIGKVQVDENGRGGVFLERPFQTWEILGRSIVISRSLEGTPPPEDRDTLVGVIARSAGVWDNDKTVCSCSGRTLWEERKEHVDRGML
jgi:copper chaperone for superoxide dismutase